MKEYFPSIWKYSVTHLHGLLVYVKKERVLARELSFPYLVILI